MKQGFFYLMYIFMKMIYYEKTKFLATGSDYPRTF